jgi:FkbM family methyltransferase
MIKLLKPLIEKIPTLANMYRFIRDSRFIYKETSVTQFGFNFIGNKIMSSGNFEKEETILFNQILDNVDLFINVGANIGYYCCHALFKNKQVIAFEPMSLNLKYLLRNIKDNCWEDNVEVYPLALSNKVRGIIEIYGGGTDASIIKGWVKSTEKFKTLVPSTTLDNIIGNRINNVSSLILVDIEGAELLMLEGATNTIKNHPKPVWLVEIAVADHQPKNIKINPNIEKTFVLFWEQGYEAWTANSECRLITPEEIKNVLFTGVDSLHTHNFLFIEKGKIKHFIN